MKDYQKKNRKGKKTLWMKYKSKEYFEFKLCGLAALR